MALAHGDSGQTPVILVIDDEDYIADMLAMALDGEGYIVHVAYNGHQGLEQALTTVTNLVIVDIMMPYLSGEELAERLREQDNLRGVPIILISAGARPRRLLADCTFVHKPFDMNRMLDLVHTCLERAL